MRMSVSVFFKKGTFEGCCLNTLQDFLCRLAHFEALVPKIKLSERSNVLLMRSSDCCGTDIKSKKTSSCKYLSI